MLVSNTHRIPVVSRPFFQDFSAKTEQRTSIGNFPIGPNAIAGDNSNIRECEQSAVVIENPFECLASFYFPEYLTYNGKPSGDQTHSDCMLRNPEAEHEHSDIQEAEEEFNTHYINPSVIQHEISCHFESDQNQLFKTEHLNSAPELIKILQSQSQKKIILEERN